jgi:hypothetical protein
MTGKQFKSFFLKRHGTKWAKGAAAELNCSRFTCQRYAIMAEIPEHIEDAVWIIRGFETPRMKRTQ